LSWSLWGTNILLTSAGLILFAGNRPQLGRLDFPGYFLGVLIALVYSSIGILIIRYRPRLPFGWLFLILAVPAAIANFCTMYAIFGTLVAPDANLVGVEFAAWLHNWILYTIFPAPFAILFTLFPNGRLPSPGWRWLILVSALATILQTGLGLIEPGRIIVYITIPETVLPISNPTGITLMGPINQLLGYTWLVSVFTIPAGAAAVLVRFRSSSRVERQQLKFLVFSLYFLILFLVFSFLGNEFLGDTGLILLILLLPIGTAMAILRYNLYGIDVIIRRTVQYTLLTGILAAVYFSSILFLQSVFSNLSNQNSPFILVISTLAIAALFNPLRLRILAFIDRRFFRSSYDAEKSLSDFAVAIRSEVDLEQLGAAMLGIVHQTIRPERASLWLKPDRTSKGKINR